MPNIQLNTINTNSGIQNSQAIKSKIPVSLPVGMYNDEDDSSNKNSKNSIKLFEKIQKASPKLEKSFNEMTINEKIALFNSLSDKEKLDLMNQSYNNTLKYVNSLSDSQKTEFLSKLSLALKQAQNDDSNPSGSQDDFDKGISNIMMIIVKAFVNNMNTDALDELQKTFEANLINEFLQKIQDQMKEQIATQESLASKMASKSGYWTTGKKVMLGISIGIAVIGVLGIFFPPAECLSALLEGGVEVTSDALGAAGESELEMSELLPENEDFVEEDEGLTEGKSEELAEGEKLTSEGPSSSSEASSKDSVSKTETDKSIERKRVTKETEDLANSESGKDNPKNIKNSRIQRLGKVISENWNTIFEDGNIKGIFKIGKGVGKSAALGGGVYLGGTTIMDMVSPNGQQNQQNQINNCQSEISSATSASDILNNNEQEAAKRVSDDAQRISQSSGYVSQAINELGNAMSFKV